MVGPQHRLRASSEIMQTLKNGRRVHFSCYDIYTRPLEAGAHVRMACIAGKRVHGSSVVRHAVQRRVRSAFGVLIPAINAPYAVVIVVTSSVVLGMDFKRLLHDIYYGVL